MTVGNLNYHVKILSASIYVKKISVAPDIKLAYAKALTQANVKYPIDRVCQKKNSIPTGTSL